MTPTWDDATVTWDSSLVSWDGLPVSIIGGGEAPEVTVTIEAPTTSARTEVPEVSQ